jgi:hypothetical protein
VRGSSPCRPEMAFFVDELAAKETLVFPRAPHLVPREALARLFVESSLQTYKKCFKSIAQADRGADNAQQE